jgi:hypothetical protein
MGLMSLFRFDDQGRLVEELVRTDHRSFCASSAQREPDLPGSAGQGGVIQEPYGRMPVKPSLAGR